MPKEVLLFLAGLTGLLSFLDGWLSTRGGKSGSTPEGHMMGVACIFLALVVIPTNRLGLGGNTITDLIVAGVWILCWYGVGIFIYRPPPAPQLKTRVPEEHQLDHSIFQQ